VWSLMWSAQEVLAFFDRAIAESGDLNKYSTLDEEETYMARLSQRVGCSGIHDLHCLRAANASALLQARIDIYPGFGGGQGAVIDGEIISTTPLESVKKGVFNRVPLMLGSNEFEAGVFIYPPSTNASSKDVKCAMEESFGRKKTRELLNVYTLGIEHGIDQRPLFGELVSDVGFHCEVRSMSRAFAKAGTSPWAYSFKRHSNCASFPGAFHGEEIAYVFQHVEYSMYGPCKASELDLALSKKMSGLWAHFARVGSFTEETWPRFDLRKESTAKLDISVGQDARLYMEDGYRQPQCEALKPLDTNALNPLLRYFLGCQGIPSVKPTVPTISPSREVTTIVV